MIGSTARASTSFNGGSPLPAGAQVAPPSSERSTPPERLPAYTISGCREENIEVGRDVASRPAGFVAAGTWSANQQRSQDQECLPHVNILSAACVPQRAGTLPRT